ncbi:alpha/beta fold hydrolase [Aquimarina litoralis]|uniref:alpha/beta fold hydrolase n=1 Tax=Aquimarina litoralis TaxID=584605 RepID=UPI001C56C2B3|nr:alpha/beta fold hydrolase [Aquimarina litoralis]MBW1294834.1 alpha/beta fold hydrolase [Aquimarina litoralis]
MNSKGRLFIIVLISLFSCFSNHAQVKEKVFLHESCQPKSNIKSELNESQYVVIGGVQQWITIKGEDCTNPIVLIVHGGPGNPLSKYHESLFKDFEEHFTIVHWDQRGSGRTYLAQFETEEITLDMLTNNKLTVDLLVKDGLELSDYIRNRLGQKKIIISGSSWGSFLATKMVHKAPNKFHFYVGLSQLVSGSKNYAESYKKVKSIAAERGDKTALDILDNMGPPSWNHPSSFGKLRKIISRYENETASNPVEWKVSKEYSKYSDSKYSMFSEEFSFLKYIGLNDDGMINEVALDECCSHLNIPIYIMQGDKDLLTVPEVTKEYFNKIKAPYKEYILIENSGHDANMDMLSMQLDILKAAAAKYIQTE